MKKIILALLLSVVFDSRAWAQSATGSSGMAQTLGYASSGLALGMGGCMIRTQCCLGSSSSQTTDASSDASQGPPKPAAGSSGAGFCSVGSGTCTKQPMGCMMGVMAVMQGMSTLASSMGDGSTAGATSDCSDPLFCGSGSGSTTGTTTGGTGGTGGSTSGGFGNLPPDAKQALQQLAGDGYSYNPADNTVTTPTGTYPASAFSSGANLAGVGAVSADQGAAIDKTLKDLLDKYKASGLAVAGGGGAGGGGNVKVEYDSDGNPTKKGMGAFGKGKTSGLKRMLASGEAIGAQVDDIFRMITAKYQEKKSANEFIP